MCMLVKAGCAPVPYCTERLWGHVLKAVNHGKWACPMQLSHCRRGERGKVRGHGGVHIGVLLSLCRFQSNYARLEAVFGPCSLIISAQDQV